MFSPILATTGGGGPAFQPAWAIGSNGIIQNDEIMKKNVAGQKIGCQLISKTDGSAITTGTTTIYICGDAGTQAVGSVGAGACTHEGYGYWTYAPDQAETNYDLIAATFVNASACNATVQVFTSFPQTGDNYTRLGAPAGASVSADVAAIKVDTAAILIDTGTDGVAITALNAQSGENGQAQSGNANSITLRAGASASNDIFQGQKISIYAGTGIGQTRGISNYNGGTKVATVARNWVVNPDATSYYRVEYDFGPKVNSNLEVVASTTNALGANAITAAATAPDFTTEIQAGLATAAALATVQADTDDIQTRLPAALVGGRLDVSIGAVANDTDAVTRLERVLSGNTTGTVGSGSTVTSIVTSTLSPSASVTDQFKGKIVSFDAATTTAALRGQSTDITASTAGGTLTCTALTTAAVSGDTFTIS